MPETLKHMLGGPRVRPLSAPFGQERRATRDSPAVKHGHQEAKSLERRESQPVMSRGAQPIRRSSSVTCLARARQVPTRCASTTQVRPIKSTAALSAPFRSDVVALEVSLTEKLSEHQHDDPKEQGKSDVRTRPKSAYVHSNNRNEDPNSRRSRMPPRRPASALQRRTTVPLRDPASGGPSVTATKFQIYTELFDEVIDRDRVFGSLLRKIKTAYDSFINTQFYTEQKQGHVDMIRGQQLEGLCEPANPSYWDIRKENEDLKRLVERLHLELQDRERRERNLCAEMASLRVEPEIYSACPDTRRSMSELYTEASEICESARLTSDISNIHARPQCVPALNLKSLENHEGQEYFEY